MKIIPGLVRRRLITLGLTCILLGCAGAVRGDGRVKGPPQVPGLGREFKLRARQQVTLKREGLRIRFVAVTEDSRCPANVNCVWAGNAAVRLEISVHGRKTESLTLNTSGGPSSGSEAPYQGYKVKLIDLKPYPRSDNRIPATSYIATLLITKN